MSKVLGEQIGGGHPVWPYVIHGHYADSGDSAALLSGALNVPMVLTGHSLGRNKLEQLLKQGRQSKEDINATYKITRRIEAEELSLGAAELGITSTQQEIEEQWGLYDGFDVKLEKVLRARARRGVNCHGQFIPRMVIPPGMDVSNAVAQEDNPEGDGELAALVGSADVSSPKYLPPIWTEVFKQLNLAPESQISLLDEKGDIENAKRPWQIVPAGHKIGVPEPLFKELKDQEVEFFRNKFSGSQADWIVRAEAEAQKITEKLEKARVSESNAKKKQPAKSSAIDPEISITRLDIRVGLITKAQKHPDADSLYVEEIDVGEGQNKTVVSGLVKYIPLEEMQNRKVCVLCNLKPANMRGVKSQAMVLAALSSDHTKVELVDPPEGAKVGERVTFPGFEGQPDDVLNPKKKVWETLQPDLHSGSDLIAYFKGIPLTTSAGVCKVSSIQNGSIR